MEGAAAHFIMPMSFGITLFMRSPYFFIISSAFALSPFIFSADALSAARSYLFMTAETESAILLQSPLADSTALPICSIMPTIFSASSPPFEHAGARANPIHTRTEWSFMRA
jgi:hypothetical protein